MMGTASGTDAKGATGASAAPATPPTPDQIKAQLDALSKQAPPK